MVTHKNYQTFKHFLWQKDIIYGKVFIIPHELPVEFNDIKNLWAKDLAKKLKD
jgi:hypothetical protein